MARRRKKSRGRKNTAWKMAKGALYTGAVVVPIYTAYEQGGGGSAGASAAIKAAAFVDTNNKFSLASGAQIWTPVAALAVVDLVTSKIGLQRRIARGLNNIGL